MAGDSDNRKTEHTPQKWFRCGYEDHPISKCPKPSKKMSNVKSKYVLLKKIIVHATTAKITVIKIHMHLWHVCLVMMNVLVEFFVTVHN